MSLLASFILVLFATIIMCYLKLNAKSRIVTKRLQNIRQCRMVLKDSTLEQRAQPNQRLVMAFGIDNAFTTTDSEWHKIFVNRAKSLLRARPENWKSLATAASDAIQQFLYIETPETLLVPLVQVLVFQTVLFKFFPEILLPSKEDIEFIASRINLLWVTSKRYTSDPAKIISTKLELEQKIKQIFDTNESLGRENPLNILLPAYETLWRIVLRTFLEVRFRSTDADRYKYKALFNNFLNNPTNEFKEHSECQVSVERIVKEGLRLYPPTRRIYRQFQNEIVAADIEHMHRDKAVWGADALRFLPIRWADTTDKLAYMPFGIGTFECPAKTLAGPMLIGILVGALLLGIGEKFELIGDEAVNVFSGVPLDNEREVYTGLRLTMKER